MTSNPQRKGEIYALSLTFLEGWFPIFASFSVAVLGGLHSYFYSLIVASASLGIWWIIRGNVKQILVHEAWFDLAMTSLFITSLFALTFVGLAYTSATNVAILLFLQILFSYLFLGRKEQEKLNRLHLIGAIFMTFGALLVLFRGEMKLQFGDLLVLLAAMIAPIANFYQKKARARVSSETVLLVRSVVSLPFVYLLAVWLEPSPSWQEIQSQFLWLFLTGFTTLSIAKILWVEAIHLLPITKVNALFAFSPLMTMGLAYLVLNDVPTLSQILGMIPILVGGYLITRR
ncbi:DMT family transporter [Thiomicrorhabdus heinhorstiae]|uniref:DMT family transporter n=1 Tax=Thiomicrorhabdus heinhorstiae TaxID=2748010 RepID=A0ABS0BYH5_9GAMM|nr:DMT family transporter [Thiomicrorhabdus heinhorstiae]MBF6058845.1 DMT family transporter [Thiomicrorhabdus heinhorstiae]